MAFSLAPTAVVASLYIAYFNRAVESAGLAYWRDQYRNELARHGDEADTNAQLSAWIYAAGQDEAALEEPLSDAEFVTSIYQNLLGRGRPAVDDIDREGFSFWLNHLEQGNVSRAEFAAAFVSGISATTDPEGAAFFALALRNSLTWARSDASQGLDADAARELGEQVLHDALYPPEPEPEPEPEPQPEPQPQPGGPIQLKHGMASARGTTGDDVFEGNRLPGAADFLGTLRLIDGLDGYDTLQLTDTATAAGDDLMLESHLVVHNVEDVQVFTTGNLRGSNHDEWDTGAYRGLETLTLQARGSGRSAVIVNTGVDLSADVAGSEFDLLGVGLTGAAGITDLTVRATDVVSVAHRGQITLVDMPLDGAAPGLTDVALIDIWGTATVKAPALDTLRLRELDDSASVTLDTSGEQAFEVQLFEVGADTRPVTLNIALENALTGGDAVTLRSMGDSNHVALTLAGGNPLHIQGGADLTLVWRGDESGGVATLNASGATGNLSVTVAADAGFDAVDLTLGAGHDCVVVELPGTVHGGGGDDIFIVRSPDVRLTGGSGNNLFDLREATQGSSGFVPSTVTITDFTAGDRILLPEGLSFNPSALHQISTSGQNSLASLAYSFWIGTEPGNRPMITDTLVRYSFSAPAQSDNAGFYLLVHDDDPALNQNDLFVHLVGVPTNAALMLNAEGYLTLV